MECILYGGEGDDMVEGVETFKYLGQPLYQMDDDWPAIRQNIVRVRPVTTVRGGP